MYCRKFQESMGLAATAKLTTETAQIMTRKRCGNPDRQKATGLAHAHIIFGVNLEPFIANKKTYTWKISNRPSEISDKDLR